MNNKVVIGGNLKLKNVVSGQAKLNNVISGTPNTSIRAGGRGGISNAVKEALLDCFEHVAWIDDDGQVYYQALYDALYARTLTSISAVFEQGQAVIYDDDSLDDLKQYLTVTAHYDDGTSAVVTTYTLSGTLNPGTSSIQVSYENKKAYFTVNVTHRPGVVTITNTLNGCTTSNSDVSMTEGDPYSATITASSGYVLTGATVAITMGGVDITSSAYNNGTISIAEVTGSLVITITAVAIIVSSISAVYTQSGTVYDTDSLDLLKADLVVTALYSDSSTATVPSAGYTLSGTLAEGTSTITVSYSGKTTTFNVTVTEAPEVALYPLPDMNYVQSQAGGHITIENGYQVQAVHDGSSGSRKIYAFADGTAGSYNNTNKRTMFTLAQGDEYVFSIKNIVASNTSSASRNFYVQMRTNGDSELFGSGTQQVASGTTSLNDVTVTGTITDSANVTSLYTYLSLTGLSVSYDVELYVNGTKYI